MALTTVTAQGFGQLSLFVDSMVGQDSQTGILLSCFFSTFFTVCNKFYAPIHEWPKSVSFLANLLIDSQCYQLIVYLVYGFNRCPTGLTPKLLWNLQLDDLDKFYSNLYIFFFVRFLGTRIFNFLFLILQD